jgi:hypothetical protein
MVPPLPDFFTSPLGITLIVVVSLWSVIWKMVALYTAGKHRHKGWFVVLFFINTVGILEIIYVAFISRREIRNVRRRNYRRNGSNSGLHSAGN